MRWSATTSSRSSARPDRAVPAMASRRTWSGSYTPTSHLDGFSLHAGVRVHENDRQGLERLCRYAARPPFALHRLSAGADGALVYRMKRSRGGSLVLVLTPAQLLARIATLVPPPRAHAIRYHGVFAPNARARSKFPLLDSQPSLPGWRPRHLLPPRPIDRFDSSRRPAPPEERHRSAKTLRNPGQARSIPATVSPGPSFFRKAKRDLLEKQLADLKARRQRESDKIAASGSVLSALKPDVDDMKRVTWYRAKGDRFVLGSWIRFYFGVGEDGGLKTLYPLRLKLHLENSNWIFAKKAIFMVDGRTFEITPEEWGHNNYSDTVWETADVPLSTMNRELMQAFVAGREVKIRYEGRERVKDVRVSPKQLDFAKQVHAAWNQVKLDEPEPK
jgi:hypothetical protein